MSAVRNLNNTDVGGRPLRIDLADSDPFLEGKTTVRGEIIDSGQGGVKTGGGLAGWLNGLNLPHGVTGRPGEGVLDSISQTLATMNQSLLMEVLAQMKVRVGCPLPVLEMC